jgi:deoxyribose-phosphate aldolase
MKRRIVWKLGDSSPDTANLVLNVSGTGSVQVTTGFPASGVEVAFSRTYLQKLTDAYGNELDIFIEVESVNDTGFVLAYTNVPDDLPLEINYFAM